MTNPGGPAQYKARYNGQTRNYDVVDALTVWGWVEEDVEYGDGRQSRYQRVLDVVRHTGIQGVCDMREHCVECMTPQVMEWYDIIVDCGFEAPFDCEFVPAICELLYLDGETDDAIILSKLKLMLAEHIVADHVGAA